MTLQVHWSEEPKTGLPESIKESVEDELLGLFARAEVQQALRCADLQSVFIKQRFRGFVDRPEKKLIFALELRGSVANSAHVIKLGERDEVTGAGSSGRVFSFPPSRMFIAPLVASLESRCGEARAAVIYPDIYQYYFSDGAQSRPNHLEKVVDHTIREGTPHVRSVERVIVQLFTEAFRCFYAQSQADDSGQKTREWLERKLYCGQYHDAAKNVFAKWQLPDYGMLRSRLKSAFIDAERSGSCGDRPYTDPVEYLRAVLERGQFPSILIGPAHGDLHGRNVIVGISRGEAEWPAVIDFDKTTGNNQVSWDFVKLEIELKCRLLKWILADEDACRSALNLLGVDRVGGRSTAGNENERESFCTDDACRLMMAIEQWLLVWTERIEDQGQAIGNVEDLAPELREMDGAIARALRIFLRIRMEAANFCGFEIPDRAARWLDELLFMHVCYGVLSSKWRPADQHLLWATLSAGVCASALSERGA